MFGWGARVANPRKIVMTAVAEMAAVAEMTPIITWWVKKGSPDYSLGRGCSPRERGEEQVVTEVIS